VAVLRDGDVIQYDEVETLYRAPHSRFVASFVGEANFFPAPAGAAAGGQGEAQTLMLRPEQLELIGPEDQAGTGADRVVFDAEIETHQFLGAAHRYACRHAGGVAIVKDQRRFPDGAAVRIAYRVSAGYLLPGGTS
jgi:ABC-type Fe3+/spermidine/putrescine transport system ATPase subunit